MGNTEDTSFFLFLQTQHLIITPTEDDKVTTEETMDAIAYGATGHISFIKTETNELDSTGINGEVFLNKTFITENTMSLYNDLGQVVISDKIIKENDGRLVIADNSTLTYNQQGLVDKVNQTRTEAGTIKTIETQNQYNALNQVKQYKKVITDDKLLTIEEGSQFGYNQKGLMKDSTIKLRQVDQRDFSGSLFDDLSVDMLNPNARPAKDTFVKIVSRDMRYNDVNQLIRFDRQTFNQAKTTTERTLADMQYNEQGLLVYSKNEITEKGTASTGVLNKTYEVEMQDVVYNYKNQSTDYVKTSKHQHKTTEESYQFLQYNDDGVMMSSTIDIHESGQDGESVLDHHYRIKNITTALDDFNRIKAYTSEYWDQMRYSHDTYSGQVYNQLDQLSAYQKVTISNDLVSTETSFVPLTYDELGRIKTKAFNLITKDISQQGKQLNKTQRYCYDEQAYDQQGRLQAYQMTRDDLLLVDKDKEPIVVKTNTEVVSQITYNQLSQKASAHTVYTTTGDSDDLEIRTVSTDAGDVEVNLHYLNQTYVVDLVNQKYDQHGHVAQFQKITINDHRKTTEQTLADQTYDQQGRLVAVRKQITDQHLAGADGSLNHSYISDISGIQYNQLDQVIREFKVTEDRDKTISESTKSDYRYDELSRLVVSDVVISETASFMELNHVLHQKIENLDYNHYGQVTAKKTTIYNDSGAPDKVAVMEQSAIVYNQQGQPFAYQQKSLQSSSGSLVLFNQFMTYRNWTLYNNLNQFDRYDERQVKNEIDMSALANLQLSGFENYQDGRGQSVFNLSLETMMTQVDSNNISQIPLETLIENIFRASDIRTNLASLGYVGYQLDSLEDLIINAIMDEIDLGQLIIDTGDSTESIGGLNLLELIYQTHGDGWFNYTLADGVSSIYHLTAKAAREHKYKDEYNQTITGLSLKSILIELIAQAIFSNPNKLEDLTMAEATTLATAFVDQMTYAGKETTIILDESGMSSGEEVLEVDLLDKTYDFSTSIGYEDGYVDDDSITDEDGDVVADLRIVDILEKILFNSSNKLQLAKTYFGIAYNNDLSGFVAAEDTWAWGEPSLKELIQKLMGTNGDVEAAIQSKVMTVLENYNDNVTINSEVTDTSYDALERIISQTEIRSWKIIGGGLVQGMDSHWENATAVIQTDKSYKQASDFLHGLAVRSTGTGTYNIEIPSDFAKEKEGRERNNLKAELRRKYDAIQAEGINSGFVQAFDYPDQHGRQISSTSFTGLSGIYNFLWTADHLFNNPEVTEYNIKDLLATISKSLTVSFNALGQAKSMISQFRRSDANFNTGRQQYSNIQYYANGSKKSDDYFSVLTQHLGWWNDKGEDDFQLACLEQAPYHNELADNWLGNWQGAAHRDDLASAWDNMVGYPDNKKHGTEKGDHVYHYDAYGNADQERTKNSSALTTTLEEAPKSGMDPFGSIVKYTMVVSEIMTALVFAVLSAINPAFGLLGAFIVGTSKIVRNQFVENPNWKDKDALKRNLQLALLEFVVRAASVGIASVAADIVATAAEGAKLAAELGAFALQTITNTAINIMSEAVTAAIEEEEFTWKNIARAGLAGLTSAIGNSDFNKVAKMFIIAAINTGAAAIEGVTDYRQLIAIAAISIAASSLDSGGGGPPKDAEIDIDWGEIGKAFVSAMVTMAVVKLLDHLGVGVAGQMISALLISSVIDSAVQFQTDQVQPVQHIDAKGNPVWGGFHNLTYKAIKATLSRAFADNLSQALKPPSYSITTGRNAKSAKEQIKEQQQAAKKDAYFYSQVMEGLLIGYSAMANAVNQAASFVNRISNESKAELAIHKNDGVYTSTRHSDGLRLTTNGQHSMELNISVAQEDTMVTLIKGIEQQEGNLSDTERQAILEKLGIKVKDDLSSLSGKEIKAMGKFLTEQGIDFDAVLNTEVNGQEMALFFKDDVLVAAGLVGASGQKEIRTFNFQFGDNGTVMVATGKIFRFINGHYQAVGSFMYAAKGSEAYQHAMNRAEKIVQNAAVLEKIKQADAVYSEQDNDGNLTRQVYLKVDDQGNAVALASEHRSADGQMQLLTYDYDNLDEGVLAKGQLFTMQDGKYGQQAAGAFTIKKYQGIAQLSAVGQQVVKALQAGQLSRVVYQAQMKNGSQREISMNEATGQLEYVYEKGGSGKDRVVVFDKQAGSRLAITSSVEVINFNDLSKDEQTQLLASLPVMGERDPAALTAKLVAMQENIMQAKLQKFAQDRGFKLEVDASQIFLKIGDEQTIQVLRMSKDKAGGLLIEGRVLNQDVHGLMFGEEVLITAVDTSFGQMFLAESGLTPEQYQSFHAADTLVINIKEKTSSLMIIDHQQSVVLEPREIATHSVANVIKQHVVDQVTPKGQAFTALARLAKQGLDRLKSAFSKVPTPGGGSSPLKSLALKPGVRILGAVTSNEKDELESLAVGSIIVIGPKAAPIVLGQRTWHEATLVWTGEAFIPLEGRFTQKIDGPIGAIELLNCQVEMTVSLKKGRAEIEQLDWSQLETGALIKDLNTGLISEKQANGTWRFMPGQTAALMINNQPVSITINDKGQLDCAQQIQVMINGKQVDFSLKEIAMDPTSGQCQLTGVAQGQGMQFKEHEIDFGFSHQEASMKQLKSGQPNHTRQNPEAIRSNAYIIQNKDGYLVSGKIGLVIQAQVSKGANLNQGQVQAVLSRGSTLHFSGETKIKGIGTFYAGAIEQHAQGWIPREGLLAQMGNENYVVLKNKDGHLQKYEVKSIDAEKKTFVALVAEFAIGSGLRAMAEPVALQGVFGNEKNQATLLAGAYRTRSVLMNQQEQKIGHSNIQFSVVQNSIQLNQAEIYLQKGASLMLGNEAFELEGSKGSFTIEMGKSILIPNGAVSRNERGEIKVYAATNDDAGKQIGNMVVAQIDTQGRVVDEAGVTLGYVFNTHTNEMKIETLDRKVFTFQLTTQEGLTIKQAHHNEQDHLAPMSYEDRSGRIWHAGVSQDMLNSEQADDWTYLSHRASGFNRAIEGAAAVVVTGLGKAGVAIVGMQLEAGKQYADGAIGVLSFISEKTFRTLAWADKKINASQTSVFDLAVKKSEARTERLHDQLDKVNRRAFDGLMEGFEALEDKQVKAQHVLGKLHQASHGQEDRSTTEQIGTALGLGLGGFVLFPAQMGNLTKHSSEFAEKSELAVAYPLYSLKENAVDAFHGMADMAGGLRSYRENIEQQGPAAMVDAALSVLVFYGLGKGSLHAAKGLAMKSAVRMMSPKQLLQVSKSTPGGVITLLRTAKNKTIKFKVSETFITEAKTMLPRKLTGRNGVLPELHKNAKVGTIRELIKAECAHLPKAQANAMVNNLMKGIKRQGLIETMVRARQMGLSQTGIKAIFQEVTKINQTARLAARTIKTNTAKVPVAAPPQTVNVKADINYFAETLKSEGHRVLNQTQHYVIYETPGGQQRIRFYAKEAVTLQEANPGRNYTSDSLAGLNHEGKVFVHEGRHRAIGAAKGDTIGPDNGGIIGKQGYLDFEYSSKVTNAKGIPVKELKIDYTQPDVSRNQADTIWQETYMPKSKHVSSETSAGDVTQNNSKSSVGSEQSGESLRLDTTVSRFAQSLTEARKIPHSMITIKGKNGQQYTMAYSEPALSKHVTVVVHGEFLNHSGLRGTDMARVLEKQGVINPKTLQIHACEASYSKAIIKQLSKAFPKTEIRVANSSLYVSETGKISIYEENSTNWTSYLNGRHLGQTVFSHSATLKGEISALEIKLTHLRAQAAFLSPSKAKSNLYQKIGRLEAEMLNKKILLKSLPDLVSVNFETMKRIIQAQPAASDAPLSGAGNVSSLSVKPQSARATSSAFNSLVDRTPGRNGVTIYQGKVYPEPATTLANDPAFFAIAKEVLNNMRSSSYPNFRKNLNAAIKKVLKSDEPHMLKEILEVKKGNLYWTSGPFQGQELNYMHILGQQLSKNTGAAQAVSFDLHNLSPVGKRFHLKEYGHPEEMQTNYGKHYSPEVRQTIQQGTADSLLPARLENSINGNPQ